MLVLVRPDTPCSIWHVYADEGPFDHWYVNFEQAVGAARERSTTSTTSST